MKKKSKLGYKRHSPDVNNPYNIIPSGRITMKDVDFPVYGVDNFGNSQVMYPEAEYQFPGNQVFEIPMFQSGGGNDRAMVEGVADILSMVENPRNRKQIASKMLQQFDDEGVTYKLSEFLNRANVAKYDQLPMAQLGMSTRRIDRILNENKDLNWVQRLYEPNTPSIQIPGLDGPSTHFMESADGRVYPTVVQMPDGNLQYLGDQAYDYANETENYIQFKNDRQAQRFAKSYKKGTGVLTTDSSGYKKGGLVKAQFGIQTAAFMPMMAQAYGAVSSWFNDDSKPATTTPAAPENVDWRTLSRPKQIDYAIGELTAFEKEENRKALENLLESTAYMENRYGEDPRAYGRNYTSSFMSIDPIALKDMFTGRGANGAYNSAQRRQFETFKQLDLPTDQKQFDALLREDNPVAAMAAARYRYALVPQALPSANDQQGMFDYWLKYYNGSGILKHKTRAEAYKDFQRAYQQALSND